jgi:hypothetical protein
MLARVDALLKFDPPFAAGRGRVPWLELALITAAGGFLYGAVMGSYGGRPLQSLFAGIKVPLFLGVSTLICLPSFYVVNTLLGLREDFRAAFRGILAAQATLAVCLAALAPVTLVLYLSISRYPMAVFLNGIQFAVATLAGQMTLARHYGPLEAARPRHRIGKYTWFGVYVFVAIQMAWVLRPFVGSPGFPTQFFREDAWSNAYVRVFLTISKALAW